MARVSSLGRGLPLTLSATRNIARVNCSALSRPVFDMSQRFLGTNVSTELVTHHDAAIKLYYRQLRSSYCDTPRQCGPLGNIIVWAPRQYGPLGNMGPLAIWAPWQYGPLGNMGPLAIWAPRKYGPHGNMGP